LSQNEKGRILIVDDDPKIRELHSRLAMSLGYETEMAADGVEALAKLVLNIDLVLLDIQMPNMDGFEVARRIRSQPEHAFLPIIMVSALAGAGEHRQAFEIGINDFIAKPIDRDELRLRSHWLLDLKKAQDRLNQRGVELEQSVERRTAELREALEAMSRAQRKIYDAHLDTIRRLTIASDLKDHVTGGHIERIGLYSSVLAKAVQLAPGDVETVRHAAPMHDVGKLGIPDEILLKPGPLTDAEWAIMRTHTTLGGDLLAGSDSEVIRMGERIARSHHEKWDGTGYPDGLAGEDIPIEARICAVVDFFDATTMDRPYRTAIPMDDVLGMMREGSGSHFDPTLLDLFFERLETIQEIRSTYLG
jgi:putative two-component system response regulator